MLAVGLKDAGACSERHGEAGLESGIDRQTPESCGQKFRCGKDDDSERDFGNHKRAAEPADAASVTPPAAAFFEDIVRIAPRAEERRRGAAQQACDERCAEREGQHLQIDFDIRQAVESRSVFADRSRGGHVRIAHEGQRAVRRGDTERAANQREDRFR